MCEYSEYSQTELRGPSSIYSDVHILYDYSESAATTMQK